VALPRRFNVYRDRDHCFFLLEEIDYFFGSDLLETIHGALADALWLLALIHVCAVLILQWWGRIALIQPMLAGKLKS
jgi:cytochrome b